MNNCQFGYITKFTQPKKKKKHHWCCGSLWPFESKQANPMHEQSKMN
jgi:hypothetical protein